MWKHWRVRTTMHNRGSCLSETVFNLVPTSPACLRCTTIFNNVLCSTGSFLVRPFSSTVKNPFLPSYCRRNTEWYRQLATCQMRFRHYEQERAFSHRTVNGWGRPSTNRYAPAAVIQTCKTRCCSTYLYVSTLTSSLLTGNTTSFVRVFSMAETIRKS